MADATYQPKVYVKQGGDELVVADGGRINVEAGGQISVLESYGNIYRVDSGNGNDTTGDGSSWSKAFKTIAAAVLVLASGDTLFIRGTGFNEAVTITGLTGIRIVGIGNNPNCALWTAPDSTASVSGKALTLDASPDWRIENIRFRPPKYLSGGVPAAVALTGVSHNGKLIGCRMQGKSGSWYGLLTDGYQANVQLLDNEFYYINTATYGTAIKFVIAGGAAEPTGWVLKRNIFHSNLNHIVCIMRQSVIEENTLGGAGISATGAANDTVLGIDLSGTTAGIAANIITKNVLGGVYNQDHYVPAGATDSWKGNYCEDRTETTEVDATTGLSKLPPAAA